GSGRRHRLNGRGRAPTPRPKASRSSQGPAVGQGPGVEGAISHLELRYPPLAPPAGSGGAAFPARNTNRSPSPPSATSLRTRFNSPWITTACSCHPSRAAANPARGDPAETKRQKPSALGRERLRLESGRLHGSGEGRQVDVGGDVLPSRLPERVLSDPARPIGLERSRPALQPDVRLNVSVIDDEEIAPLQGLGCLPAPALELEADLKPVPLLETGSCLP